MGRALGEAHRRYTKFVKCTWPLGIIRRQHTDCRKFKCSLQCPGASATNGLVMARPVTKKNLLPLWTRPHKPYYCVTKYPNVGAVLSRRLCLAMHRRGLHVHLPPATGKASALVRMMTR
jgi:hypothetical protein